MQSPGHRLPGVKLTLPGRCRISAVDPNWDSPRYLRARDLNYILPSGSTSANTSGRRHRTGTTRLCVISDARRRRERFGLFRDANGLGAEVSCGNCVKEGAHVGGALGSERLLEPPLRLHPSFNPRPETGFAGLGHPQLLAPAITATLFDGDQAIALQRQDVAAERRSVHHDLRGKGIDRRRAQSPQLRENGKLRRAQPARRQKLIVELRDVACGLAHRETVAVLRPRISAPDHRNFFSLISVHLRLYSGIYS